MNFSLKEISCRCGCGQRLNRATVFMLENARLIGGNKPIVISSASRCIEHNKSIPGASPISLHLYDMAVDVIRWGNHDADTPEGLEAIEQLFKLAGWYTIKGARWLHADIRTIFPEILKIRSSQK